MKKLLIVPIVSGVMMFAACGSTDEANTEAVNQDSIDNVENAEVEITPTPEPEATIQLSSDSVQVEGEVK